MATVRFGNDTVSGSGVRFDMRCRELALGWKNFIDIEQKTGISPTSGLDVRLPSSRYQGHEAPIVTMQGAIDTSISDPSYNSDGNPYVTVSGLGALALVGSGYLLYPAVTQFLGKAPINTGSISAMVTDVKLQPDIKSFAGGSEYIMNYSMEFALVSGPV